MSNMRRVGKGLYNIAETSKHNIRRAAENFPKTDRGVAHFNKYHPYVATFKTPTGRDSSVTLDILITDSPVPCTINPPLTRINTMGVIQSSNPGYISNLVYNNGGFKIADAGAGIIVPKSGCYDVYYQSIAAGYTQMGGEAWVGSAISHNGEVAYNLMYPAQGVWAFMGGVWTYAPPSPIHIYVEALEGDTIGAALYQSVTSHFVDWWGPRDFHLWINRDGETTLKLELIAEFEV